MKEKTSYFVTRHDEIKGAGSGPSSHIPTLGAATTAIDQYRTAGIHSTNLPECGAAFTDVAALSALSRVAEGGLRSAADLEAAETALQALLLYEIVHTVVHAPKLDFGNGLISYKRWDQDARSDFAFELMGICDGRDFLIAPEFLESDGEQITGATFADSPLLGKRLDSLVPGFAYWNDTIADAVNTAVAEHGIPAYLSDPLLVRSRRGDGFAKHFYERLRVPWNQVTEDIPPVECTFSLPPLLAIVLDRLNNRQDLKSELVALREELADVRTELREFNSVVTAATTQQEIARRVKWITESFDAIIPESSLRGGERFLRRLAIVQRISRPIVKFMAGFVTKTGPSLDELMRVAPTLRGTQISAVGKQHHFVGSSRQCARNCYPAIPTFMASTFRIAIYLLYIVSTQ